MDAASAPNGPIGANVSRKFSTPLLSPLLLVRMSSSSFVDLLN